MLFQVVADLLGQLSDIRIDPALLETPQDRTMGDVALPCFSFAKALKKSPVQIAQEITDTLHAKLVSSKHPSTGSG
jgi:arginyl-tRNA synthetase